MTRTIARLVLQDEARHVAYGLGHLERSVAADPALRSRLRVAIERRHDALRDTAGLNDAVYDALVVLAAGAWCGSASRPTTPVRFPRSTPATSCNRSYSAGLDTPVALNSSMRL